MDILLKIGHIWDATGDSDSLDGAGELVLAVEIPDIDIGVRAG